MLCETFLIAAVSARALTQSAARGGFQAAALDLFDDRDLAAKASRRVCAKGGLRFNSRELLSAAKALAADLSLIYGSGFEGRPQLLSKLAQGRVLLGNSIGTFSLVNDPACSFSLLDKLGIPHPEVSFTRPCSTENWLGKKTGAAGGWHVRPASAVRTSRHYYFQRRAPGVALSVLFLADGRSAHIVGFNETWCAGDTYSYAGAISRARLSEDVQAIVAGFVQRLVEALGLVGLNGMDFMLRDDEVTVLEVNARPPATLELYDEDFAEGLFAAHVEACRGRLPRDQIDSDAVRASAVVYAELPLVVPPNVRWPSYAADIPRAGAFVQRGAPVCTVKAEGDDFSCVKREAFARRTSLQQRLQQKAA